MIVQGKDTPNTEHLSSNSRGVLMEVLRRGAQEMLAAAIEIEVVEYMAGHTHLHDTEERCLVARSGYLPQRAVQIDQNSRRIRFSSKTLPPYLRRTNSIDELISWLYLKGVSTGDLTEALQALLGPQAEGLSATNIVRPKDCRQREWAGWSKRSLTDKHYAHLWAGGIYFNIGLEDPGNSKQCTLALVGVTNGGKKELTAISDCYRESVQSWRELLLGVKERGLSTTAILATGDRALGFWAVLRGSCPATGEQRCWIPKTANVLSKMAESIQPKAKSMLQDIWMAETRKQAQQAFDLFLEMFKAKHTKAVECLAKDRGVLLRFHDFPAGHLVRLRAANPIESTSATVRLRTRRTKGCGSRMACLPMVFKRVQCTERHWRRLSSKELMVEIIRRVKFVDGIKEIAA